MLTFSIKNIRNKLDRMPMAMMTIPLIIGIIVAYNFEVSSWIWCGILCASLALSFLLDDAIIITVFALGAIFFNMKSYSYLPQKTEAIMTMKITDNGINYGRYSTFSADVFEYNGARCRARVRVTADSTAYLRRGDLLTARSTIRPFGDEQDSYVRSMHRQGYSGRVSIKPWRILWFKPNVRTNLHDVAVEKLQSLLPKSDGRDIAISLALGAKRPNSDIKRNYSLSGVSHLLAVSGLHVGMVSMLLSLLLLPLSLVWRGNSIRAWIIVVLIWFYVALCGYPTSAIRAAIMFSTLQISHLTRNRYSQENSIFTAAFCMLALKPTMLFEISFTLSFIAVMAIIFISKPINSGNDCKNPILRELMNGFIVSCACVLATIPLVSNTFGIVSTLSVFITPVVLIFSQIIIISSLLALAMPYTVAQSIFRAAEWCADIQNLIVEKAVATRIGYAELRIDDRTMVIIYAVMVFLLILSFGFKETEEKR